MSEGTIYFLPWLRTGLAAAITSDADEAGLPQERQAVFSAQLSVSNLQLDEQQLPLRGPESVIGLDPAQVIRQEPKAGSENFDRNYFPYVELASPDLPWLFTPARANDEDRLRPWLVLVVLPVDEITTLIDDPLAPLPVLKIAEEAGEKLPPLNESWAWVHVHTTREVTAATLEQELAEQPAAFAARLMCPIFLEPHTAYLACLVPAFKPGVEAGLGLPVTDGPLANAWEETTGALDLPVYYSWSFATGENGDFEALARRLRGVILDKTVGVRPLDLAEAGPGLPLTKPDTFAGALLSPQAEIPYWFRLNRLDFVQALGSAVNSRRIDPDSPPADYQALRDDPVVSPPLYGSWQRGLESVPLPTMPQSVAPDRGGELPRLDSGPIGNARPLWASELNLQPAQRGAAGLGAEVIRRDQEALMAEAWLLARNVRAVNRELAYTRQAAAVSGRLSQRLRGVDDDGAFLQLTRSLHRRLRPEGASETAFSTIQKSENIPNGVISLAIRRQSRTVGAVHRRLAEAPSPSTSVLELADRYLQPAPEEELLPAARAWEPLGLGKTSIELLNQLAVIYGGEVELVTATVSQPIVTADTELSGLAQLVRDNIDPQPHLQKQLYARVPALEAFATGVNQLSPIVKRAAVSPRFKDPAYKRLRDLSPEYLLPGFSGIPQDSVSLLKTNRLFIEAYMVGLNHEMSREFLWREYPAVLHETWFKHFWQRPSGMRDMTNIRTWDGASSLGWHAPEGLTEIGLVVLIKGELVRRYPNVLVYAERADGARAPTGEIEDPVFRGDLGEGTLFAAFAIDEAEATGDDGGDGWFFVLQEHAAESRFGLDLGRAAHFGQIPRQANNISWRHAAGSQQDFAAMTFARTTAGKLGGALAGAQIGVDVWGSDAAAMARLTYQRPVRMLIHGDQLLK